MLETRSDALPLNSLDVPAGHLSAQKRILGITLEPTSTERAPLDVDRGSEQDVRSLGLAFIPELFPYLTGQLDVKRGTETGSTGKTVGRGPVEELDTSDTVGSVGYSDGGDGFLGDIDSVPKVLSVGIE